MLASSVKYRVNQPRINKQETDRSKQQPATSTVLQGLRGLPDIVLVSVYKAPVYLSIQDVGPKD